MFISLQPFFLQISKFDTFDKHTANIDQGSVSPVENCNPIDLSIIIKTNLMKTNDIWNNKALLQRASSLEERHSDMDIRKALLNSGALNQINAQYEKDAKFKTDEKTNEEDTNECEETALGRNFHDENCNIKVE